MELIVASWSEHVFLSFYKVAQNYATQTFCLITVILDVVSTQFLCLLVHMERISRHNVANVLVIEELAWFA